MENLYCYGTFNTFVPTSQNNLDYYQQSGLANCQPYGNGFVNKVHITNNSGSNAVSIFSKDNDGINQGGNQTKGVFMLKLSDPVSPGCKLTMSFKAGYIAYDGLLSVFASNADLCNTANNPACPDNPNGSGIFHCLMSDQLINSQMGTVYTISYINNTPQSINYIMFSSKIKLPELFQYESQIFIDDVVVMQKCNDICVTSTSSVPCIGKQMEVEYTFCNNGTVSGPQNININAILATNNPNITLINNADFTNGSTSINGLVGNGPCVTKKLIINIPANVPSGTTFTIQIVSQGTLTCLGSCAGNYLSYVAQACPIVCPCNTAYNINGNPSIYISQTNLPPTTFNGPCLSIAGNLIINTNYTFQGGEIRMEPGSSITITNNSTVRFLNVNSNGGIHGCDKMWKGITVEKGSTLEFTNNVISDAENAVHFINQPTINAPSTLKNFTSNYFTKNVIGLFLDNDFSMFNLGEGIINLAGTSVLEGNEFSCNDGGNTCVLLPDYPGQLNHQNQTVAGIKITNYTFSIGGNRFKGLRNGIFANFSVLSINKSRFTKIWPLSIPLDNKLQYPDGDGITANNSICAVDKCDFRELYRGINGARSSFVTSYNVMVNVIHGIHNENCSGLAIHQNENILYKGIGINIDRWAAELNVKSSLKIQNNDINAYSPNEFTNPVSGIRVDKLAGDFTSNIGLIENNTQLTNVRSNGIEILNTNKMQVKGNSISHTLYNGTPPVGTGFKGGISIYLANAQNCLIKENYVQLGISSQDGYTNGIMSTISPNNRYCCNTTSNQREGIRFIGVNNADYIRHNNIHTHTNGLRIDEGLIGIQDPLTQLYGLSGNKWNNSALTGGFNAFNNSADKPTILQSKIISNTCNVPYWPSSISPAQTCPGGIGDWFERPTGTNYNIKSCGSDGLCNDLAPGLIAESVDSIISDADVFIARGTYNHPAFKAAFNFDAQLNLYTRLKNFPYLLGLNSSVDSFYTANLNSNINQAFEINKKFAEIYHLQGPESIVLENLTNSYIQSNTRNEYLNTQLSVTQGTPNFSLYLDSLNMLNQTTSNLFGNVITTYNSIHNFAQSRAQEALWSLQSYLPDSLVETNFANVQTYRTKSLLDGFQGFTTNEKTIINNLADACVLSNGSPVLMARGLRNGWDLPEYEDYENCIIEERENVQTNPDQGNEPLFIMPNPATNQLTILVNNNKNVQTLQINVYSVQGLLMDAYKLKAETHNKLELNTSNYPNGVYVIHSVADNGKVNTQKFIIQK